MQPVIQMRDVWTVEDLQALDLEDWGRYEIVDGALVVSPTPGVSHAYVLERLQAMLRDAASPDMAVLTSPVGVTFGRSYRIPDLVIVPRGLTGTVLVPSDLLLAVEVVSPGSVTEDRVTKPAQYAAAGIPNYWRVEQDPLSLTAYRLAGEVYAEVGTWHAGEVAELVEPFPIRIEVDRLAA